MGKINWGRVFLCGVLSGVVGGTLLFFETNLLGSEFLAAVSATGKFPESKFIQFGYCLAAMIMLGIWSMWLYAAIRPRYGAGPKTAAIAGLATAVFGVMADAVWGSMGFISPSALVAPVAGAVPVIIVAALVGAWPYKE